MEHRVIEMYGNGPRASDTLGERAGLRVIYPPLQRDGYVEQQIVEYAVQQSDDAAEELQATKGTKRKRATRKASS